MHRGDRISVIVENTFPFGVFCRTLDNGERCYIRRRELTLQGTIDPRSVVHPGDQLEVQVLDLPTDDRIMEISLRRMQPDPWIEFSRSAHVKDLIKGTVKFVWKDRVVVEVLPGVDGTIAREDLSTKEVIKPEEFVWPGDRLEAMILRIDPPARKLQLSIRHARERGDLISRLMDQVQEQSAPLPPSDDEPDLPLDLQKPDIFSGAIGLVDDDPTFRQLVYQLLESQGCRVTSFEGGAQVLQHIETDGIDVLITDISMPMMDGLTLARKAQQLSPETVCIFISDPDHLYQNQAEIESIGGYSISKPLQKTELVQLLGSLSTGTLPLPAVYQENVQFSPFRTHEKRSAEMRSDSPFLQRVENVLTYLSVETGAEKAILFYFDPISRLISITAHNGTLPLNESQVTGLVASPVEDVITEDTPIHENNVPALSNDRYLNLLRLLDFKSCIGVPVRTGDQRTHALFVFHSEPGSFSHYRVRDVQAAATLISVALEHDLYRAHVQQSNSLLIGGQLILAFNHEIYNKIAVLELQLDQLKTSYLSLEKTVPQIEDTPVANQMVKSFDEVVLGVRSIRKMGEEFRNILKGTATDPISIAKILELACEQVKPAAIRSEIKIVKDFDFTLPEICINRFSLIYTVYNLLLNAVQHMENRPGERHLTVQSGRRIEGEHAIIFIRVIDTGPGIHRHLWQKIFELGYTSRPGGSGLGLYIAKSLVDTLNGKIFVEDSLIDSGTVFRLEIPEGQANL